MLTWKHILSALILGVLAIVAPAAADCGQTDFIVTGSLTKRFELGPNESCLYNFSWGTAAGATSSTQVSFSADEWDDGVGMYNDNGTIMSFGSLFGGTPVLNSTFYWPPGTVHMDIYTSDNEFINVTTSFYISTAIKDAKVTTTQVITGSQPIVVADNLLLGTTYVYQSTSKIVFSVVNPEDKIINSTYFDSVFAYDGIGPSAKFIGSLNQLLKPYNHVTSSNSLTLFPTTPAQFDGKVVINNMQNLGAFDVSTTADMLCHCSYDNTSAIMVSNEFNAPGASSILSCGSINNQAYYPVITSITFSDTTPIIQVFSGLPTNKMAGNYIKQYTPTSVVGMSRQLFKQNAITFTITSGYAYIYYDSVLYPNSK